MKPRVLFHHLGRMKYAEALKVQHRTVDQLKNNEITNHLLTLEHDPVYTIGIRSKDYDAQMEKALIKKTGADFVRTNRGGLITFHGPGQLVVYPILDLRQFTVQRKALLGVKWYINQLEETIIKTCINLGISNPTRSPHTGVWVGDNKICAMGVRNSEYVTYHGLALNCNTDLTWYKEIIPCGIEDKGVTSLSNELGRNVTLQDVLPAFRQEFKCVFNCDS
nr:putative lipoyltransferase 2, mitochondrial [Lepeophtheirus salmonis]